MNRARGATLIEFVLAVVLVGIIVGATVYFFYPVTQAVDLTARAELTDIADNALQRIGREARLSLPNSVRQTSVGSSAFVEFLPVRLAGRYRADGYAGTGASGTDCPADDAPLGAPDNNQLSFAPVVDTCFKTIGPVLDAQSTITSNDFVVFNNYGPGFTGQDAYATSGASNRRKIATATNETTQERITFASTTALDRTLHDSPGKRFFVIVGNATTGLPEPVTYQCDTSTGTLVRRWGYTMTATQPTTFTDGTSALLANNVSQCTFDYGIVAPQIGLLTLRLELSKALSNGATEKVSLYHAVHIVNAP